MATALKKLGYAEFLKFPDDGNRHEIIEGEWFMTPPPNLGHQGTVGNADRLLGNHIEKKDLGWLFVAPAAVFLGKHDIVEPDLFFVAKERRSILRKDGVHGAPDLVIEVLSPSTAMYDRNEKLALYQRSGVRWPRSSLSMGWPAWCAYKEGQSFTSALLPGLTIRVDDLFKRLP